MAREASHYISYKLYYISNKLQFYTEYDSKQVYHKFELVKMFTLQEWHANKMGAFMLISRYIIENIMVKLHNL